MAELNAAKNFFDDLVKSDLVGKIDFVSVGHVHVFPEKVGPGYLAPVKGRMGGKRGASFDLHIDGKTYVIPYQYAFNPRLPMTPGEEVDFDAPLWLLKDRGITE